MTKSPEKFQKWSGFSMRALNFAIIAAWLSLVPEFRNVKFWSHWIAPFCPTAQCSVFLTEALYIPSDQIIKEMKVGSNMSLIHLPGERQESLPISVPCRRGEEAPHHGPPPSPPAQEQLPLMLFSLGNNSP